MMRTVLIVESPVKAKTIEKYLGKDFTVIASFGHIRDLPSGNESVDVENNFTPKYEVPPQSKKHLKNIIDTVRNADEILLAADPDREGEAISWNIIDELKKNKNINENIAIHRIVFNQITAKAIKEAIKNPRDINMNLVDAQQARRILDYLVGFNVSPVLWRKLPGSKSAGRVQSVALRIVCDRENEIEKFQSQEYWSIEAEIDINKKRIEAILTHVEGQKLSAHDITSQKESDQIIKNIDNSPISLVDIITTNSQRNPSPPFITSTLQQEAANKLNMRAKQTMQTAQKLYEGIALEGKETFGLITYMRTDSTAIAPEAIKDIRQYIANVFPGKEYLAKKERVYKSKVKNAQEAHEAIRPTDITLSPEKIKSYLSDEQYKLYKLIWQRTLATQAHEALIEQTALIFKTANGYATLRSSGSIIKFDGFMRIYDALPDKSTILPTVNKNDKCSIVAIKGKQHFTQPPPRYREASLIKTLEEMGIGRPSTYAGIMSTLIDRAYVKLENKALIPTTRGLIVTVFLCHYFSKYVEYDFTANLEERLDKISNGIIAKPDVLQNFWDDFIVNVKNALDTKKSDIISGISNDLNKWVLPRDQDNNIITDCPKCKNGKLQLQFGKFGAFAGCNNYPECKFISNSPNDDSEEYPKIISKNEQGSISLRKGPYGIYLQLDKNTNEKDNLKPKRIAIPNNVDPYDLNTETAEFLLSLPKEVCKHPQTNMPVIIGIGRFGPYILYNEQYKSIGTKHKITEIDNETILQILDAALKKPKKATVPKNKKTPNGENKKTTKNKK